MKAWQIIDRILDPTNRNISTVGVAMVTAAKAREALNAQQREQRHPKG